MIVETEIDGVKYEGVLEGTLATTKEVAQYAIIVHDPLLNGGRKRAFLCPADRVPTGHVVIGTLAIKY